MELKCETTCKHLNHVSSAQFSQIYIFIPLFFQSKYWHQQDLHVLKNERAPNAILKIEYLIDEVLVNSFKFDWMMSEA